MTSKEALERLEKLEKANSQKFKTICKFEKQLERYEDKINRLEKVIEIILVKGANKRFLIVTKNVDDYNKAIKYLEYFDELTQEEYELLKEDYAFLGDDF